MGSSGFRLLLLGQQEASTNVMTRAESLWAHRGPFFAGNSPGSPAQAGRGKAVTCLAEARMAKAGHRHNSSAGSRVRQLVLTGPRANLFVSSIGVPVVVFAVLSRPCSHRW
jgi:hypothetical protein